MARRNEIQDDDDVTVFETIPARMNYQEPEREETEAERKTREFFDELNGKDSQEVGYIDIYKVAGASSFGAKDYCGREPSDKFTDPESLMMYLRENFGPGNYRITGRIDGKKGIKLNTLLSIAKRNGDENPRNLPAVIGDVKPGNDLAVLIAAMNQQNQQNMQMILETIRPDRKSILDHPIFKDKELLALLLPVAVTAVGAVMKNRRDPMEQITQLLTITGTIKDMREDDRGGDNPDSWPALVNNIVGQLGSILPAVAANKQTATPAALPQTPRPAPQGIPPIAQAFAPHLAQLVQMADAGADPDAAAKAVLSSVPPHLLPTLLEFLDSDTCISSLARVNMAVLDRAIWFDELRCAVLDAADGPADTGQTDSTGPDNEITGTTDPTAD